MLFQAVTIFCVNLRNEKLYVVSQGARYSLYTLKRILSICIMDKSAAYISTPEEPAKGREKSRKSVSFRSRFHSRTYAQ